MGTAASRLQRPIRAEVFGIDRLGQHAESLAAAQPTADERARGRRLLPRVRENGKVLLAGYRNIVEAVRQKGQITQAEEWILDNFHVVDEQVREIRDHLPRSFYKVLPKIAKGYRECRSINGMRVDDAAIAQRATLDRLDHHHV